MPGRETAMKGSIVFSHYASSGSSSFLHFFKFYHKSAGNPMPPSTGKLETIIPSSRREPDLPGVCMPDKSGSLLL
jgi:hypothetical protein